VLRDNQSTMKLEQNGKASSGNRTRHFNIKFSYITDLIDRKEVTIKYCPTDDMIADYMTKPLTGSKFNKFRNIIMNGGLSNRVDNRSVLGTSKKPSTGTKKARAPEQKGSGGNKSKNLEQNIVGTKKSTKNKITS
jgi:hypothetical protein